MALFTFFLLTLTAAPPFEPVLDRPVPDRLTGRKFRMELNRPISAVWKNVPLRTLLNRLADDRQIAILLDRRIDPTQEPDVDIQNESLRAALDIIARAANAEVSIVDHVAYIGPPRSAAKLRTLIALRSSELSSDALGLPSSRFFEFATRRTFHWNDLDRPRNVLRAMADECDFTIHGLESIPHDLWAGATLPRLQPVEALSLVLIQFDATFAWTDRAAGIQIVPAPESVAIEKRYSPGRTRPQATLAKWRNAIPDLQAEVVGGQVVVRGTVEQHEAIAALSRSSGRPRRTRTSDGPPPIRRRLFTLRIENVPASALVKKLEASEIEFDYDEDALDAAGIDLDQPISLDVKQARAEEFFKAVFDPLGLNFEIDDLTITLTPR